jgi:trans-2,3-dihydro-3-hydroxyanthranilate isomerase
MLYDYVTLDVFTDNLFGGNPLAVLPDATGLTDDQMQAIAREFAYSETTFVLPPEDANNTRRVRIFTRMCEIPFAGHPNVGTAVALARLGLLGEVVASQRVLFEEPAGVVSMFLHGEVDRIDSAEFIAPAINQFGDEVPAEEAAKALGLPVDRVVTKHHAPRVLTVGVRFLYVELKNLEALAASEAAQGPLTRISLARGLDGVFIYTRTGDQSDNGIDVRARMFAPVHGVMEDAASGSASAGLANILAAVHGAPDATLKLNVSQGVEMGRPSRMQVTARRNGDEVAEIRVSGGALLVCRGQIEVPAAG